jgi:hypothetical protein
MTIKLDNTIHLASVKCQHYLSVVGLDHFNATQNKSLRLLSMKKLESNQSILLQMQMSLHDSFFGLTYRDVLVQLPYFLLRKKIQHTTCNSPCGILYDVLGFCVSLN